MKPFNLDKALAGEPVMLRNGNKAEIYFLVPDYYTHIDGSNILTPIRGLIFDKNNNVINLSTGWTLDGYCYSGCLNNCDIVGMWEEKELTQEEILEKAYNENLRITFLKPLFTNYFEVIAKTKHNSYIIQNDSYIYDTAKLNGETFSIYEGKKGNEPENLDIDNTITVTLPKPFKPKEGQAYYYISDTGDLLVEHFNPNEMLHVITRDTGRCFRTHEDAQEWLDAVKNALDN